MNYFYFPIRFGTIVIYWSSQGLLSKIELSKNRLTLLERAHIPSQLFGLMDELISYFCQGKPISAIPWDLLDQAEWSPFQARVYRALSLIPHGETRTYGWVARRLGQVSASRAVGQALKKNPFPILIPCHRVFGCHALGGFLGVRDPNRPELKLKMELINLEKEYCSPTFAFLASSVGLIG